MTLLYATLVASTITGDGTGNLHLRSGQTGQFSAIHSELQTSVTVNDGANIVLPSSLTLAGILFSLDNKKAQTNNFTSDGDNLIFTLRGTSSPFTDITVGRLNTLIIVRHII